MVYFCLSPRHHSSLLPVPLLSLCYNEERLKPELGLGAARGGGQRFPPNALPFTPNPHALWDADMGVIGTQRICFHFFSQLLLPPPPKVATGCPVQMVLEVLEGLALGIELLRLILS